MTPEHLEAAIARGGPERLRWLTSDANPDAAQRDAYRRLVVQLASGAVGGPPPAPTPLRKAASLARTLAAWAKDRFRVVRRREFERRRKICMACPNLKGETCGLCGCNMKVKPWLKAAKCPDSPPRW